MRKILLNGGWLVLIPLVFNVAFYRQLPRAFAAETFWKDIPAVISYPENILRIVIFATPFALSIDVARVRGLALYVLGLIVYMTCWSLAMFDSGGAFVHSRLGFMSLAYTSGLWLAGIAFSTVSYWGPELRVRYSYLVSAVTFVVFHTWHTYYVYTQID